MIEVTDLVRRYGDFTAVDQVSFQIKPGEIVGILGHNGAGKTTILKMLTGSLEPTSGQVKINDLDYESSKDEIHKNLGYLPENCPLYPEMTVLEYLNYVAKLWGYSDHEKIEKIQKAINKTKLQDRAHQTIDTLSKGYKQRVGVARAILSEPQILILDEPTNGLDPSQILEMRQLIKELGQSSTVILSTHILQEVEAVCDRVMIIHQGKLARDAQLCELQVAQDISLLTDAPSKELQEQLQSIEGFEKIHCMEETENIHEYRIQIRGTSEKINPMIAQKIIENNWNLFELKQEKMNLEQVFRQVNEGGYHA